MKRWKRTSVGWEEKQKKKKQKKNKRKNKKQNKTKQNKAKKKRKRIQSPEKTVIKKKDGTDCDKFYLKDSYVGFIKIFFL